MLKLVYESETPKYYEHDIGETDRPYEDGGLLIQYHPELHEGKYQETIHSIQGLTVGSGGYVLHTNLYKVRWPGWDSETWVFDSGDGRLVGRGSENPNGDALRITVYEMMSTPGGELWGFDHWQQWNNYDPDTYEYLDESIDKYHWWVTDPENSRADENGVVWSFGNTKAMLFDRGMNRAIGQVMGLPMAMDEVGVFDFNTGELLYKVPVCGRPYQIYYETSGVCHVVNEMGMVTIIDYKKGTTLGVFRHTLGYNETQIRFAYDRVKNRVLKVSYTPDEGDGACTIRIHAYDALPRAVYASRPIPCQVPREHSPCPVITRIIGDAGEALTSINVTLRPEGEILTNPSIKASDIYGWALFSGNCLEKGEATVTVEFDPAQNDY